jgi:hypothetical protein
LILAVLITVALPLGLFDLALGSLASARASESARVGSWQEPVADLAGRVTADYQAPAYRWSAGHRGVDAWVEPNESILSPIAGSVHFAGRVVNRGVVSIIDDRGVIASFEPVCALVIEGQRVSAGEVIAFHCSEAETSADDPTYQHCEFDCIHISARIDGAYLSPLHLVYGLEPSRLWPLAAAS